MVKKSERNWGFRRGKLVEGNTTYRYIQPANTHEDQQRMRSGSPHTSDGDTYDFCQTASGLDSQMHRQYNLDDDTHHLSHLDQDSRWQRGMQHEAAWKKMP